MKKRMWGIGRTTAGIFICAGAVFFTACGAGDGAAPGAQTAETGQAEAEQPGMTGNDTEASKAEEPGNTAGGETDISKEDAESAADGGQWVRRTGRSCFLSRR